MSKSEKLIDELATLKLKLDEVEMEQKNAILKQMKSKRIELIDAQLEELKMGIIPVEYR